MKILTYRELLTLRTPLATAKTHLSQTEDLPLQAWQGELVAVLGQSLSCQKFFKRVLLETYLQAPFGNTYALPDTNFTNAEVEKALISPEVTIYKNIYIAVCCSYPSLTDEKRATLTQRFLKAALLQSYSSLTAKSVSETVRKQTVLAILFAAAKRVVIIPNIFDEATPLEKTTLHQCLQNLRWIQPKAQTVFLYTQEPEEAIYLADRILVISSNPAGFIGENISVYFTKFRSRSLVKQLPSYKAVHKRLSRLLIDTYATEDLFTFSPQKSLI